MHTTNFLHKRVEKRRKENKKEDREETGGAGWPLTETEKTTTTTSTHHQAECRGQNDVVTKIAEYKIPSSGASFQAQFPNPTSTFTSTSYPLKSLKPHALPASVCLASIFVQGHSAKVHYKNI